MDQALRARNPQLASATVRKQRFTERQNQRHKELEQQRATRQARHMRYSLSISGSDSSRSASPNEALTPANSHPDIAVILVPSNDTAPEDQKYEPVALPQTTESATMKSSLLERRRSKLLQAPVMFTASLSTPSDYRYDRYSTIIDTNPIKEIRPTETTSPLSVSTASISSGEEEEEDDTDLEDYSPIEVATPVAIRMPLTKPAVVSVNSPYTHVGSKRTVSRAQTSSVVHMVDPLKSNHQVRASLSSIRANNASGFLASEARPMEVASQASASTTHIQPLARTTTTSSTVSEDPSLMRRKGSLPMLSKFTNARVNNIKNMMRNQSISQSPSTAGSFTSHQSHSSMSLLTTTQSNSSSISQATHNPYRASLMTPRMRKDSSPERRPRTGHRDSTQISPKTTVEARPQTAHRTSTMGLSAVAYSNTSTPPPPPMPSTPRDGPMPRMSRRKSLSNLAFKFAGGKAKPEECAPPVPTVNVPSNNIRESIIMAAPASRSSYAKTPRSVRKSGIMMMSSPFSAPSNNRDGPIGLGLRLGAGQ